MARRSFPGYYRQSGPSKEPPFTILVVPLFRDRRGAFAGGGPSFGGRHPVFAAGGPSFGGVPPMFVKLRSSEPLGQQIYQAFRRAILAGEMPPAARLPSTRALGLELGV